VAKIYFSFFFSLLFSLFALHVKGQELFNDFEQNDSTGIWIGVNLKDSTVAFSGRYSSYADSLHPYGVGIKTLFPESVRYKNCFLKVSGRVSSTISHPDVKYVITLQKEGKNIFWKGVPLSGLIKKPGKWYLFEDSIKIPANITAHAEIKTYLWNAGRTGKINMDDLTFSFEKFKNPTFLPKVKIAGSSVPRLLLFSNSFYKIFQTPNDNIIITDTSGRTLLKNLILAIVKEDSAYLVEQFKIVKKRDGSVILLKAKNKQIKVDLALYTEKNSPAIDFSSKIKFKTEMRPGRIVWLADYDLPVKEIFKYNRQSDVSHFQYEYWLDKEGVLFGDSLSGMAVYHNTGISSLQLDTKNKTVLFNLDYENDHHFLKFPLLPDTMDVKMDESKSRYEKREILLNQFRIFAGVKNKSLPVFMKNPDGFLATYIWTEHADWTDLRTHRATFFGSEKITLADSAIGGFVKYHIPVTKSVFYDNPDSISNAKKSNGLFLSLEESIVPDSTFLKFLEQLRSNGHEICLHTPDHYTTDPVMLEKALSFMEEKFGSRSWIDHGYNNGPENNREDLVCDGPENFAAPLWKQYDIRYFWNPYYEDFSLYSGWSCDNSIEKAYSGYGDFFPRPDYWQHPTLTGKIYHWPTPSVMYIEKENLWGYYFSKKRLDDFVNNWSLEINHCYPAWTYPGKGFWKYTADSTIVAMDGFNRTLAAMAALRDEGKLNVTTIGAYLDYRTAVDGLDYSIRPDGRVAVTNNTGKEIKGISMNARAVAVSVNDLQPAQKRVGDYLIFWFDLKNGETKMIRVIQ
jgi:hypothetical protein